MENKEVYELFMQEEKRQRESSRAKTRENLGKYKADMEKLIDVIIDKEVNRESGIKIISNNRGRIVNKVDLLDRIQNIKDILELVYILEDSKERDLLVALLEQMYVDINKEFKIGVIRIE